MKIEDLKQKIENKEDVLVLDVREGEEVGGEKIDWAQHMPMGKVFLEAKRGTLPKDKKIVAVCKTGGRCEIVARELRNEGYDIEHLEGGIEGWKKEAGL